MMTDYKKIRKNLTIVAAYKVNSKWGHNIEDIVVCGGYAHNMHQVWYYVPHNDEWLTDGYKFDNLDNLEKALDKIGLEIVK